MVDKDRPNGPQPMGEGQQPGLIPDQNGRTAVEPVDPRILSIARAIGRLIARERFKELTEKPDEREER